VAPNCAAKDNWQGYRKALSKKNQELSKEALPALFKPNRSTSQAGYKHSPKASYKHSTNSLEKRKRSSGLSSFS
jgi:hypothetical protein